MTDNDTDDGGIDRRRLLDKVLDHLFVAMAGLVVILFVLVVIAAVGVAVDWSMNNPWPVFAGIGLAAAGYLVGRLLVFVLMGVESDV